MIEYRVVDVSPNRLVVRHEQRDRTTLIFIGILAALAAAMFAWLWKMPGAFTQGPLVPFLAFFGFLTTVIMAIRAHRSAPHALRFDAAAGTMTILDATGHDVVAMPLGAIASVEVRTTRSSGSSGSSSTTTYHAEAKLADGATIPVYYGRSSATRDAVAESLRSILATAAQRAPVEVPRPTLAPYFVVEQDRRETRIAWRSSVRASSFLSLSAALVFLWLLLGVFIRLTLGMSGGMTWLPVGFLLCFGAIPTLVLGIGLVNQLRMHRRQHVLRVTDEGLAYHSRGALLRWEDAWTLGRDAVASVRLLWGTGRVEFPGAAPAADDGKAATPPRSIELGTLPKDQIVAFEQWLERELAERWGRRVG